jgi:hypothetical protein
MSRHHVLTSLTFAVVALLLCALVVPAGASAPANRYTVNGGTVYDTKTKLTWQQTAPATQYSWSDAKAYCASSAVSSTLGGPGWRLPTIKELQSLIDYKKGSETAAAIDSTAFPGTPTSFFWSSTPLATASGGAWTVSFQDGTPFNVGVDGPYYARCVR